jgi:aminopeptidase-like protein
LNKLAIEPEDDAAGNAMHNLIRRLFPICRSITGDGTRETLAILREHLPELKIYDVPSGTKCFDWVVPDEWNIKSAQLISPAGDVVVDFADHNLHVVNYSIPTDQELTLEELQNHLHSLPEQPTAIPYVTSYYEPRWGFCMTHKQRVELKPGTYRATIDSRLEPGSLSYGELVIPGETKEEIFVSTYICHPSMANNELSGPVVSIFLAKWLMGLDSRRYTYRFVFAPETIGALAYLSGNLDHLKKNVRAAFNLTCLGDERCYSYLASRNGTTISDRIARHTLRHLIGDFAEYSFLDRGSDERQYCAPGVDLPMATIMRSKYRTYPEYHTSLDDLDLVTPAGLAGSYKLLQHCLSILETNRIYRTTTIGDPQLGRRGLYTDFGERKYGGDAKARMDILAYADGAATVLDIAEMINMAAWDVRRYSEELLSHGLLQLVE